MPITPEFTQDLETMIVAAIEEEYAQLIKDLWWDRIMSYTKVDTKKALVTWLLSTASIERPQASHLGGQARFDDLVAMYMQYEVEKASAGLEVSEDQVDDVYNGLPGGEALAMADKWARDVTKLALYWPQEELGKAILANPVGYDGVTFFHGAHPVNPYDASAGAFANHFTGAAAGNFPGALPINGTLATALENVGKALAYIGDIKLPNGKPRRLKVGSLVVPPALAVRATEITQAKFIAKDNGTQDVEGVVSYLNLGKPIIAPEIGAGFSGGSNTACYLAVEEVTGSDVGAFTYVERKPFEMNFHSGRTSAELAVSEKLQYLFKGRNTVAPGHPYKLYKLSAT